MLTSDDIYLFSNGMWQRAWEKMGAHRDVQNGTEGWMFRVWAPQVVSVHLVGDFNGWDPLSTPLTRADNSDIWEAFVPGLQLGDLYKYAIKSDEGELLWKADPFGFFAETCPGTASKLWDISGYAWKDATWLRRRAERDIMKSPLNIYEVHLGSWKRHGNEPQGEPREDGTWPGPGDPFPAQRGTYYTYDDLSDELVAYVKKMGYTHIEVMPLMEHPFDGSWGYQATGYFAATSRYGTPQQLMHFVDSCHKAGIGVILDWVPGGFCANAEGLATFNGHMLFEREIHPNWGTHKFDFGRPEVRSFLVSNVLFWIENFHVDGIRMDGVSSMLYLNFGVDNPADKKFNKYGTEEDLDASAFIRQVNCAVGREFPDVMMIAEESTAWPLVTYPAEDGGLGFHLKWDMGWMNDTLHYMQCDFPWRPGNHSLLTFSIMYAFSENFVLPLSHDEVVNGKCSLIGRMPGDDWRRFAGLRTLFFYQITHPGAKLSFMGDEIGQQIEWRYYESIEWFLAHDFDATHGAQQRFIEALNHLYTDQKALWQNAYSEKGFEWIDADNSGQSILSFVRHGDKPADDLLVLINFDPASYETYRVGVPREGDWELVFTSDDPAFGGSGYPKVEMASSKPEPWNGRDESIEISVPGLAGLVYRRRRASSYKPAKPAKKATGKAKSASARAAKPKAAKAAKTAKVAPKAAKEPTKISRAKKA
ncbi:1,4-alpha-glucan branching protein GlgB [Collinsella stercoris]|uniref:1,4-alpha-glucan branching protein GlgB n=1 Tax=Collinsella stercoris TaxID=147206 RepID=UPI00248E6746|nr:1,4-alpha-glucan branching protein GlgB [Collinsella stercoris]